MNKSLTVSNKERIAWIDNVRFFAMLCVILYHSSALVDNEYYYAGWIIESFNMALFFFLSGLTSYNSVGAIENIQDWFNFLKKRFIRIMMPCLFVSLLVFQKPCSFWFLLTLFYYLMAFASFHYLCTLLKISRDWAFLLFSLLLFVKVPYVGNNQEFVLIFVIGLYLSRIRTIDWIYGLSHKKTMMMVINGFVLWLLLLPFYKSFYLNKFYDLIHSHTLYLFLIRQIAAFSFAIACCFLFKECFNKQSGFSAWGGANFRYVYYTRYNSCFVGL